MLNPYFLAEQCVHKGLMYLSESLQYYWPANYAVVNGVRANYLNEIAENNIALHLARSFAENGFHIWAEVPLKREHRRLDFLAYHYGLGLSVALEFKKSIETPQENYKDLKRLVHIKNNGLSSEEHGFNGQCLHDSKYHVRGIVTLLSATEFADWWAYPKSRNYIPAGRKAYEYSKIGNAIAVASHRAVVPLCEYLCEGDSEGVQYRFRRAAYALYDDKSISALEKVLRQQNGGAQ